MLDPLTLQHFDQTMRPSGSTPARFHVGRFAQGALWERKVAAEAVQLGLRSPTLPYIATCSSRHSIYDARVVRIETS